MPKLRKFVTDRNSAPMRVLGLGIALNVILIPVVASLVWEMYRSLSHVADEGFRLQQLAGNIAYLHEVLTDSARMAAATGSLRWEERYRRTEPELDDSIAKLALLARREYEKNYVAQTKLAYLRLIEMETLAFALVRKGRRQEASELLFSREYEKYKSLYAHGLRGTAFAVRKRAKTDLDLFRKRIWKTGILSVVSLVFLLVSWLTVSLVLKRHLTQRRRAEQSLVEEKERLAVTLSSIGDGVITADTSGKAFLMNPPAEQLTGWTQQEAIGRPVAELLDIVDEKTREKTQNPVDYVLSTNSVCRIINHTLLISRDGAERLIEHSAAPICDRENNLFGAVLVFRDVTERKQAERTLRDSEEKYRTIIENIDEGYYEVDLLGNMVLFNDAMATILGYTRDELVGVNHRRFMDKATRAKVRQSFRTVYISGKPAQVSGWELNRKDGARRIVEASVSLVTDDEGVACGFRGIVRDITDRQRIENRLRQAAKMEAIGTLAGGIAHDFNNILYVITGFTELALDEVSRGTRAQSNLEQVIRAAQRAKELVDQILTFSRHSEHQKKIIRISPILKETLRFLRASIPATVEIRPSIDTEIDMIMADPTQIHQVIMNLCSNAAHAMREKGGVLQLRLDNGNKDAAGDGSFREMIRGPHVRLTVTDNGHGMSSDVLERIFDPYFSTKERSEGTGLGLSVVHGIVKSHGGTMTVHSEAGKGSVFSVYFPVAQNDSEPQDAEDAPCPSGRGHILVVDDEQGVLEVCAQMLQLLGYQVSASLSPLEALDLFRDQQDQIDLVITDMTMPKMTGKELAQEILTIRQDIPVILCTGFSELITEEKASSLGIKAFLRKPVLKTEIAEAIHRLLPQAVDQQLKS